MRHKTLQVAILLFGWFFGKIQAAFDHHFLVSLRFFPEICQHFLLTKNHNPNLWSNMIKHYWVKAENFPFLFIATTCFGYDQILSNRTKFMTKIHLNIQRWLLIISHEWHQRITQDSQFVKIYFWFCRNSAI